MVFTLISDRIFEFTVEKKFEKTSQEAEWIGFVGNGTIDFSIAMVELFDLGFGGDDLGHNVGTIAGGGGAKRNGDSLTIAVAGIAGVVEVAIFVNYAIGIGFNRFDGVFIKLLIDIIRGKVKVVGVENGFGF